VWDTGLRDDIAETKGGVDNGSVHMTVSATLINQLKALGVAPKDVTHVAFSHMHFDHTGNANLFERATWVLNRTELAWALTLPGPFVQPESFSAYKGAKTVLINSRVPEFNTDRADTLASMNRIERIAKKTKARLVIQHDPADFAALPRFPAYLE